MSEKYIKRGICYCKKDCYYDDDNKNYSYVLFQKGKTYNYIFENDIDDVTVWIIYNESGSAENRGRRFYFNENDNHKTYLSSYHKYFENVRKAKLNKIYECTEK